jgi:hypothetical protein
MSKISKYVKLDKNVLLEYTYNDTNLITESYNILVNSKYKSQSYLAADASTTANSISNQLFKLDTVSNRYGKIDTNYYTFLQEKNYSAGNPIKNTSSNKLDFW